MIWSHPEWIRQEAIIDTTKKHELTYNYLKIEVDETFCFVYFKFWNPKPSEFDQTPLVTGQNWIPDPGRKQEEHRKVNHFSRKRDISLYLKGRNKANHTPRRAEAREKGRKTRSSGNQWNIPTLWPASSQRCSAGSNPIFLASNFNMLPSDHCTPLKEKIYQYWKLMYHVWHEYYSWYTGVNHENLLVMEAHVLCTGVNYRARPVSSLISGFCDWNCHDI